MIRIIIKVLLTSVLIVSISEIGKRNSIMAAIYASLPLTTILAMIWLYMDTFDNQKVSTLSWNVLIAVIPSHIFLISFPLLIKYGLNFWLSMTISAFITALSYWLYVVVLKHYIVNF